MTRRRFQEPGFLEASGTADTANNVAGTSRPLPQSESKKTLGDGRQTNLFRPVDPAREAKERRLMEAVDALNLWGGRGTVRAATLGAGGRQDWQMRRERKTPCYTTQVEDLPRARI